jgi:Zn finger protein HypA/HybF involved in hydrogenase expression
MSKLDVSLLPCPVCHASETVAQFADLQGDAARWDLWCAQCGHEWTIAKETATTGRALNG